MGDDARRARRVGAIGILAPRLPEDLRRAGRRLRRRGRARGRAQGQFDTRASHIDPKQLDSWIAIAADGSVTAYTGKCELGQGIHTAQIAARRRGAVAAGRPRHAGAVRHRRSAPIRGRRRAASRRRPISTSATWRRRRRPRARRCSRLAATRLGVPADELAVAGGTIVSAEAIGSKRVTYGELVAGRKFNALVDANAKRKAATRVDRARHLGAARRHGGDGDRPARVRPQRARARDAARRGRSAAVGRRHARRRRRSVGPRRCRAS